MTFWRMPSVIHHSSQVARVRKRYHPYIHLHSLIHPVHTIMNGLNDDIRQMMARNQEILELRRLGRRNFRLTMLKAQHRRETLLASFEYDSWGTWHKLTEQEKREKEYTVKALSCGTFFNPWHRDFEGYNVVDEHFPQEFLEDRDAVLAYVSQPCFQKDFRLFLFEVPESLRDDKEVMLEVCRKNSKALRIASSLLAAPSTMTMRSC